MLHVPNKISTCLAANSLWVGKNQNPLRTERGKYQNGVIPVAAALAGWAAALADLGLVGRSAVGDIVWWRHNDNMQRTNKNERPNENVLRTRNMMLVCGTVVDFEGRHWTAAVHVLRHVGRVDRDS